MGDNIRKTQNGIFQALKSLNFSISKLIQVTASSGGSGGNNTGAYLQETLTTTTPKVLAADTYKEINFVVESGSVTVNDGTNTMVYTDADKSVGFNFTGDAGIPNTITLTLAASSTVKLVTKAV